MFKSYWLSLRFIANDVSLLFRNFLHWNLSKIAILVVTLVTSIVVSMPLVVIGYWMVGDIVAGLGEEGINDLLASGALPESVVSALIENYWIMGGIALLALLILTVFTVFMTYGYYLTSRVYESYINGNRLSIFRNEYWNLPRIWKFIGVLSWSSLYLLAPLVCGLVGMGILMYLTTGSGMLTSNFFIGFILGLLGVTFVAYFTYVAIRVMFSYINLMADDALRTPALELVKRSVRLASGKVLRIVGLVLPYTILVALVSVGIQEIQEFRDIRVLESRAQAAATENVNAFINDHAFIQNNYIAGYQLTPEEKQDVIAINNAYAERTDGIDPEYLRTIYPYIMASGTMSEPMDIAWQVGTGVLAFLLLEGVMIMVYLSVFHILKNEEGAGVVTKKKAEVVADTKEPEVTIAETPAKKTTVAKKTAPSKTGAAKKPAITKNDAPKKATAAPKKAAAKK